MNRKTFSTIVLLVTSIAAMPAYADKQKAQSANKHDIEVKNDKSSIKDVVFSELERQIINRYFNDGDTKEKQHGNDKKIKSSKKMPKGLAKKESLPPGLAMQLEKNGTLPPGLAKRDLPDDLSSELPEIKDTLERKIVDKSVVLIEKATGRVLDVIEEVITN